MLERPPHCMYPKRCAAERVCQMAKDRELKAHRAHDMRQKPWHIDYEPA